MSNKAGNFAENLAVTSNITSLAVKALGKVSDQQDSELSPAIRSVLVTRVTQRLAANLRQKQIEG